MAKQTTATKSYSNGRIANVTTRANDHVITKAVSTKTDDVNHTQILFLSYTTKNSRKTNLNSPTKDPIRQEK